MEISTNPEAFSFMDQNLNKPGALSYIDQKIVNCKEFEIDFNETESTCTAYKRYSKPHLTGYLNIHQTLIGNDLDDYSYIEQDSTVIFIVGHIKLIFQNIIGSCRINHH